MLEIVFTLHSYCLHFLLFRLLTHLLNNRLIALLNDSLIDSLGNRLIAFSHRIIAPFIRLIYLYKSTHALSENISVLIDNTTVTISSITPQELSFRLNVPLKFPLRHLLPRLVNPVCSSPVDVVLQDVLVAIPIHPHFLQTISIQPAAGHSGVQELSYPLLVPNRGQEVPVLIPFELLLEQHLLRYPLEELLGQVFVSFQDNTHASELS